MAGMVYVVSLGTLPPADFTFCNGEIKSVDPAQVTGQPEGRIVWALFEGLCRLDPETLEPIPGMAESWTLSDDGLTYTFRFRANALWSDGSPVTADDFHYSYRRVLHPETACEYAGELWYIEGARKYTSGQVELGDPVEIELEEQPRGALPHARGVTLRGRLESVEGRDGEEPIYTVAVDGRMRRFQRGSRGDGIEDYRWLLYDFEEVGVEVLDPETLRITLEHPTPYFLSLTAFYPFSPVNRDCVDRYGSPDWTKPENIVSNGPFVLQFRRIRDRVRLAKNPHYWDSENVHLETIDALAVSAATTMLNLYMTGVADWIPSVPVEAAPVLMERPEGDFRPAPYLATYYYMLNTADPALADRRVRRALHLAIDREELVTKVTRSGQVPAYSIVPDEITRYMPYTPQHAPPRDVEAAQRLMAEAGYPGGRGFPRIEILYNDLEAHRTIAELIQSQWTNALGIETRLAAQEWGAYLSSRQTGNYQVARAGWIGDYVDPNTFLKMFTTGSPLNQTRWSHGEYDALVDAARRESAPARRLALMEEAEAILMDELPVIPLYFYVSQNMVRPYVEGFYHNIQDIHPLQSIRIDPQRKAEILGP